MFNSVISSIEGSLSIHSAIICTVVSLILGFVIAGAYMLQGKYTKNFVITLVLLPALVQSVIMLVNGNLGTSVAVMGAFSLVRFRSLPGSSRDISTIFFAMVIGLATGMGFLGYAGLITGCIAIGMVVLSRTRFAESKSATKDLKITIPESLDYTEVFDDLLEKYTKESELVKVKTTNMGSMYELLYRIELKEERLQKKFIDEIRCRNGNLTIICGRPAIGSDEL
ncbi:DUF4956 domain-containing protein [Anaerosporobacter faecicola]|uniref:DUF4956 domain-containing protein n=1 Tax=Anaerosporobacter faecicola TaxID=2718714 RepID=UPI00143ADAAE|nr:DUF4956 domain-containing protein [Anaerosporobacter faecicola]